MRIAYHNHFAEFRNVFDGRTAYEVLLEALDPAVLLELDTYWAHTGGADPAAVAASLGPRLESVHLKDGPARGMDDHMVPFGEGVMDVEAAARANPAVRWHIVEMDRSHHDMYELLGRCYDHLVGHGLSRGNDDRAAHSLPRRHRSAQLRLRPRTGGHGRRADRPHPGP